MPDALDGREGRYRRQAQRMANQRDHYRDRAIEAVAWLILRLDNDYELLDGDDLAAARSRAVELGDRRRMIRRPSPVRERMGYRSR